MNGDNINVDVYSDVDDDVVIVRILVVGDDDEPGASRGVEGDPGPSTGLERLLANVSSICYMVKPSTRQSFSTRCR